LLKSAEYDDEGHKNNGHKKIYFEDTVANVHDRAKQRRLVVVLSSFS